MNNYYYECFFAEGTSAVITDGELGFEVFACTPQQAAKLAMYDFLYEHPQQTQKAIYDIYVREVGKEEGVWCRIEVKYTYNCRELDEREVRDFGLEVE